MENKIGKILIDWLNDRNRNFQVLDTETYFDLSLPEKELYILKETLFDDFKKPTDFEFTKVVYLFESKYIDKDDLKIIINILDNYKF